MKIEQLCTDLELIPEDHKANLIQLIEKLNPIEEIFFEEFGYYWTITNGYRFMSEHVRIYKQINEKRKLQKKKPLAIPLGSQHLKGNAVDIWDPKQDVKLFVNENRVLFKDKGFCFEKFIFTDNWVHAQQVPVMSGEMFFAPY